MHAETTTAPAMRLRWHLRRIRWAEPGTRGLALLGIVAVLMLVPFHLLSFVESRVYVVSVTINFGTLVLSFLAFERSAARDAAEFWLALQGKQPSEWALERWAANLVFASGVVLVWVALAAAAKLAFEDGVTAGAAVSAALSVLPALWLVLLVASALFFALGATGTAQVQSLAFLFVLGAALSPLLARFAPESLATVLRILLPPIAQCAETGAALNLGEWRSAVRGLLHIGTWCLVVMSLGVALLNRRVPRP